MNNNFTLSINNYSKLHHYQSRRLKTVINTTSLYEALYIVDKLFPDQWNNIKENFEISKRNNKAFFEGMGLKKEISEKSENTSNINYQIFGRCINIANNFSTKTKDFVFLVPGNQKIANSVVIENFNNALPRKSTKVSEVKRPEEIMRDHSLINQAKQIFESILSNDPECNQIDQKDLVYQCLFRLTSYNPGDYCKNLTIKKLYGIEYHECGEVIKSLPLFQEIYQEQKRVLDTQYYASEQKLFQELSSKLKTKGKLKIVGSEPYLIMPSGEKIALEYKKMATALANRIHKAFHYIHTPRNSGYTYGLFIKGDSLPISVIGVEKVDRDYKKIALLKYNISPDHTYELTRMYSCKNSPSNTSSFMLAITNSFLKKIDSNWQASISSFMPSYATGLSMVSGGFKNVLFAKECVHNFEKTNLDDVVIRTNRSKSSSTKWTNRTKLMPVLELIYTTKSFLEAIEADKKVISFSKNEVAKK